MYVRVIRMYVGVFDTCYIVGGSPYVVWLFVARVWCVICVVTMCVVMVRVVLVLTYTSNVWCMRPALCIAGGEFVQ